MNDAIASNSALANDVENVWLATLTPAVSLATTAASDAAK
jgi:hypothetical protein